ncbi:RmlC-like cupin domain-containing protein [Trichoderma sp. SZMC 28014]
MPTMQIARSGRSGAPSINGATSMPGTFAGNNMFLDPVIRAESMSVANVNFAPCSRTHWHTHAGGQLLTVLAGSGWICGRGEEPVRISVGDVVWCPPGTTHWHGADDMSYMVHQAVTFGSTEWHEVVGDEEYGEKKAE